MTYTIRKTDGSVLTTLGDGLKDNAYSSLTFIGRNLSNFGEYQNNNFLHLLENFAFGVAPANPLKGQIWYDINDYRIKIYNGGDWLPAAINHYSSDKPSVGHLGYLWYDTVYEQLHVHNGADYVLVGPERAKGFNETRLVTTTTNDLYNNPHPIVKIIVDGETVAVVSTSDYSVSASTPINGVPHVYRGITLKNEATGDFEIHGRSTFANLSTTATNLNNGAGGSIPYQTSAGHTTFVPIAPAGSVLISSGSIPQWSAATDTQVGKATTATNLFGGNTGSIPYQTSTGTTTFLSFIGNGRVLVSGNGAPYWKSESEFGAGTALTATRALSLLSSVSSVNNDIFVYASTSSVASTVAERDSDANLKANFFVGVATQARYADLAEKYLADSDYEVGTVMVVGGEKEVTASTWGQRAIGVVSANPAYMMNSELEGGTYIALKGRVPVKVEGSVKKGDELIANNNGTAVTGVYHSNKVFAVALESNSDIGVKLIEAIIL
jgi:hypothetical protein